MTEEPVRGTGPVGQDVDGFAPTGGTGGGMPPAGMGGPTPPPPSGGSEPPPEAGGGSTAAPGGTGGEPIPPPPGERVFDAGTDPNRNAVQAGAVCLRLAQIQCAGEDFCCENPGRDRATCEAEQAAGCMNELYLDQVSANPIVAFDPGAAMTAFTQLENMASQCDPTIASYGASGAGLLSIFRGTRGGGDSCSPAGIDRAAAAAALASCADPASTACLPNNALSWNCAPRGPIGSPCFSDLNCHEGLMCPNPNFSFGEVACAARKPAGTPCQLPNECESLACRGGACTATDSQSAYCLKQ